MNVKVIVTKCSLYILGNQVYKCNDSTSKKDILENNLPYESHVFI